MADLENSALAGRLIQQSCLKHGVQPRVLTLHSDRGADEPYAPLNWIADRAYPLVSSASAWADDNPFSEAQFKWLGVPGPSFPGRWAGIGPSQDVLSIVLPLVQCRAPPWRHLDLTP